MIKQSVRIRLFNFFKKSSAIFLSMSLLLSSGEAYAAPQEPTLSIPRSLGTIEESFKGQSDKTIFVIQDAHDSLEAQENIAKLIGKFVKDNGVKTVFEEGYEGPVPSDDFFGFIKDPAIKQKVSYFLLDKLRIGGAEYAHINRTQNFNLIGIEKLRLYKKNISAYQKSSARRKAIEADLTELSSQIHALMNQYFPRGVKAWLKHKDLFSEGRKPLLNYLRELRALYVKCQQGKSDRDRDFAAAYPSLMMLLRAEIRKDKVFIKKLNALDSHIVFEEVVLLENDIAKHYLQSERDRTLFDAFQGISLLKKLNRIELTQEEYEAVKTTLEKLNTQMIADFIVSLTGRSLILSKAWEGAIKDAIEFYAVASKRDQSMEKSMVGFLKNPKEKTAILVYGGFHAEGIKEMLQRQGFSYHVISPSMTRLDPRHQAYYKRLMSAGYSDFEVPFLATRANKPPSIYFSSKARGEEAFVRAELRAIAAIAGEMGGRFDFRLIEQELRTVSSRNAKSLVLRSEVRAAQSSILNPDATPEEISEWFSAKIGSGGVNVRDGVLRPQDFDHSDFSPDHNPWKLEYGVLKGWAHDELLSAIEKINDDMSLPEKDPALRVMARHNLDKGPLPKKWEDMPLVPEILFPLDRAPKLPPEMGGIHSAITFNLIRGDHEGSYVPVLIKTGTDLEFEAKMDAIFDRADLKEFVGVVNLPGHVSGIVYRIIPAIDQAFPDVLMLEFLTSLFPFSGSPANLKTRFGKVPFDLANLLRHSLFPVDSIIDEYNRIYQEEISRSEVRILQPDASGTNPKFTAIFEIIKHELALLDRSQSDGESLSRLLRVIKPQYFKSLIEFRMRLRRVDFEGYEKLLRVESTAAEEIKFYGMVLRSTSLGRQTYLFETSALDQDPDLEAYLTGLFDKKMSGQDTKPLVFRFTALGGGASGERYLSEFQQILSYIDRYLRQKTSSDPHDMADLAQKLDLTFNFYDLRPFILNGSEDTYQQLIRWYPWLQSAKYSFEMINFFIPGLMEGWEDESTRLVMARNLSDSHMDYFYGQVSRAMVNQGVLIVDDVTSERIKHQQDDAQSQSAVKDFVIQPHRDEHLNYRIQDSYSYRIFKRIQRAESNRAEVRGGETKDIFSSSDFFTQQPLLVYRFKDLEKAGLKYWTYGNQAQVYQFEGLPFVLKKFTDLPSYAPLTSITIAAESYQIARKALGGLVPEFSFIKILNEFKSSIPPFNNVQTWENGVVMEMLDEKTILTQVEEAWHNGDLDGVDQLLRAVHQVILRALSRGVMPKDPQLYNFGTKNGRVLINDPGDLTEDFTDENIGIFLSRLRSVGNDRSLAKISPDLAERHLRLLKQAGLTAETFQSTLNRLRASKESAQEITRPAQEVIAALAERGVSRISYGPESLAFHDALRIYYPYLHGFSRSEVRLQKAAIIFANGSAILKSPQDWATDLVTLAKREPKGLIVVYNTLDKDTFAESKGVRILKSFELPNIRLVPGGLSEVLKPYQFRENVNLIHYSSNEKEAVFVQSELPEWLAKKLTRFVGEPGALGYGLKNLEAVKLKEQEASQLNRTVSAFVVPGIEYRQGHYVVSPDASAAMLLFQKEQFALAFAQAA